MAHDTSAAHTHIRRITLAAWTARRLHTYRRVIWACLKKDILSVLTEKAFLFQTIILPLNYNLLLILFVLSGSNAPTAVVMQERGPLAQRFVQALGQARSFHLQQASAPAAQALMAQGEIVAIITIPAQFDQRLRANQAVQVGLVVNNLNTDMTDDVRRGTQLAITQFYQQVFPKEVSIAPVERDAYPHDTGYIPYLSIPVIVIGLLVGGLLQAGVAASREWEKGTMKELLLSPAPAWAIMLGKLLASGIVCLAASSFVLLFVILIIGDWPQHWASTLLLLPLITAVFVAAGTLLGTLVPQRQTVTLLTRGIGVPLFFLSGIFIPISFSTPAVQFLARLFPVHYAIVLLQFAFANVRTNTLGVGGNLLVLCGFLAAFLLLAAVALRRSTVAH